MSKVYSKKEVCARLRGEINVGRPLFMPNAGCGLSAKLQEMGGADLITVSSTSYYRLKGLPSPAVSQPFGDLYEIILNLADEISAMVKETPLVALTYSNNPLHPHKKHLETLREHGISGVTPVMTQAFGSGKLLNDIGLGFDTELDMVRTASDMDMFTFVYAYSPKMSEMLAQAGADVISTNIGPTTGGLVGGSSSITLDDCVDISNEIFSAARKVNPDVILFCHGGPIENPEDAEYIVQHTDAEGYIGGSSSERIPMENGILEATRAFKSYKFR